MIAIDHIVFPVRNLEAAAERLLASTGLASVEGGRHLGHGTANAITPLGSAYLELVAVVDPVEAASSRWGSWVAEQAGEGMRPAAWCLRTADVAATAERNSTAVTPMERRLPSGDRLAWRLTGLEAAISGTRRPFFIQWEVRADLLPGAAAAPHRRPPTGIGWVEVGEDPALDAWLGAHGLDIRVTGSSPGIRRIGIATGGGELVL